MGYRSDLTLVFYARGNSNDAGENALLKLWFDENYPVQDAKDAWCATIRYKDNAIIVDYEDVKWYDNYDHMKQVANARANFNETFNCDEENARYAWEMLRIGEEDNDIERDSSSYADYRINVERSMIFE